MVNIIKVVCVIIGTIIGAGFASGKEIYVFFNQYGINGILGLTIASILTGIITHKVLMQVRYIKVKNYNEYLEKIGVRARIKEIFNIMINVFLLITFYIMISGFCAYFKQEFNIPHVIISTIICIICYFTFINHIEGVTKMNTFLIPFLIIMIIFIGIKCCITRSN